MPQNIGSSPVATNPGYSSVFNMLGWLCDAYGYFCTKEANLFFTVALMKQSRRSGGKGNRHSVSRPVGISRRQGYDE
ncbi:MAG: hypothetical protein ACRC16_12065 [Aeromonas salmonicida]